MVLTQGKARRGLHAVAGNLELNQDWRDHAMVAASLASGSDSERTRGVRGHRSGRGERGRRHGQGSHLLRCRIYTHTFSQHMGIHATIPRETRQRFVIFSGEMAYA